MATSNVTALRQTGLNDFLFAEVGTEANGLMLSVLSIFARQGSDPWREASRLAELPKSEATKSLAQAIASMPKSLWSLAEAAPIAARLVELLPSGPVREATRSVVSFKDWRLPNRTMMLSITLAFAAGYAVAMLLH